MKNDNHTYNRVLIIRKTGSHRTIVPWGDRSFEIGYLAARSFDGGVKVSLYDAGNVFEIEFHRHDQETDLFEVWK